MRQYICNEEAEQVEHTLPRSPRSVVRLQTEKQRETERKAHRGKECQCPCSRLSLRAQGGNVSGVGRAAQAGRTGKGPASYVAVRCADAACGSRQDWTALLERCGRAGSVCRQTRPVVSLARVGRGRRSHILALTAGRIAAAFLMHEPRRCRRAKHKRLNNYANFPNHSTSHMSLLPFGQALCCSSVHASASELAILWPGFYFHCIIRSDLWLTSESSA